MHGERLDIAEIYGPKYLARKRTDAENMWVSLATRVTAWT